MAVTIPRLAVNAAIQAATRNTPPLKLGSTGEGVCILQQAFIDLGFQMPRSTNAGASLPDGIFGKETDLVVKQFQGANALNPDGIVGPLTLKRLEDALSVDSARRQALATLANNVSRPIG